MKVFKIILDIIMFLVTFALIEMDITGNLIHEILGITIAVLAIIHVILNWKWFKNVSKNLKKVNKKSKIMWLTDILICLSYLITIVFGILISNEIFTFKLGSNSIIVITHLITGRLSLIFMLIHVGLHLDRMFKNEILKTVVYILYPIFTVGMTVYLIYALTHSFQWVSLFGRF